MGTSRVFCGVLLELLTGQRCGYKILMKMITLVAVRGEITAVDLFQALVWLLSNLHHEILKT